MPLYTKGGVGVNARGGEIWRGDEERNPGRNPTRNPRPTFIPELRMWSTQLQGVGREAVLRGIISLLTIVVITSIIREV
jgi:hypothetical protein